MTLAHCPPLYIDVRIPADDAPRAIGTIIAKGFSSIGYIGIDPNPPASGAEVQISVQADPRIVRESSFVDLLREHGVTVLASRARHWTPLL